MRRIRFGRSNDDGRDSPGREPIELATVWREIEARTWRLDQDGALALLRQALAEVDAPPYDTVQWMLRWVQFLRQTGDLEHAVDAMTLAAGAMERFRANRFTIEMYLRLPALLVETGQRDRAWAELERRLEWVREHVEPASRRLFLESKVRDAMRLMLQREGRAREGVEPGGIAHVLRAQALHEAGRHEELDAHRSRRAIERHVASLLRKSGDMERLRAVCDVLEEAEGHLIEVDAVALAAAVRRALSHTDD